jgi:chromosome segregation ATPase
MSQELSAELLEIENKIGKLESKIEEVEESINEKYDAYSRLKKGTFESYDSFEARSSKAESAFRQYDQRQTAYIKEMRKDVTDLQERKKKINEQLYAGLDESEDF